METIVSKSYLKYAHRVASRRCAEQCAAEGYPSHGENYDLRMQDDGWMDYLPTHMFWDRVIE